MEDEAFLATVPPWSGRPDSERALIAPLFERRAMRAGDTLFAPGDRLDGLYVVRSGLVRVSDPDGTPLALVGPGGSFGERGLLADGYAPTRATAVEDGAVLVLPAGRFLALVESDADLRAHFEGAAAGWRRRAARPRSLAETPVSELMSRDPLAIGPAAPIAEAARLMGERGIGSLLVAEEGRLLGIVTLRDLARRVLAGGLDPQGPVALAMTPDPVTLPPDAIGSDVLHLMVERGIGHLPILGPKGLEGIVTRTDLTRFHAESSADLVGDAARAPDAEALAAVTARLPAMLARLAGAGDRHDVVTRLLTDVADAVTRRLLVLARAELGPPPVPFLWLACGSQGRREQTGISDQDNCLIIDDAAQPDHEAYFAALARFVCTGLDRCGYVFCPGGMMATNPRWRQPLRVWRRYFRTWIERPDPEAQMLASVMFDLRPIGGELSLHEGLQAETLEAASRNSIFVAHMVANALKHSPPLGLLRGLVTLRTGEHRNTIDMKLSGVIPVVDLGRVYALQGRIATVNTRARLAAAMAAGVISEAGGRDLIDAYDTIADARLAHQARQLREGTRPDNFLDPATLSEFERNHLREAFLIVRRMQGAVVQGRRLP